MASINTSLHVSTYILLLALRALPYNEQKSVPNGHGLLLQICGGDEGDRTPYLLNAIQALSQVSYTPTRGPLTRLR